MEKKHQKYDLYQMQSLPLEAKIRMTQLRIRQWHEAWDGKVYVSFSGGKDSTVLLDIVRKIYPEVPAVFSDTGLEYPEIRDFVRQQDNVTIIKPEMNFRQVVLEYGYPVISKEVARALHYARKTEDTKSKIYYMKKFNGEIMYEGKKSAYNLDSWKFMLDAPFEANAVCCDIMKKRPFHKYEKETGNRPIVGTMASESRLRYQGWIAHGCNAFESKRPQSNPLSFWTEQDILTYLLEYQIPYCSVYGTIVKTGRKRKIGGIELNEDELTTTGCKRTGCMFCMFGCHLEKHPNRFEMMRENYPNQYNYCMKPVEEGGLGLDKVLNFIGVKH